MSFLGRALAAVAIACLCLSACGSLVEGNEQKPASLTGDKLNRLRIGMSPKEAEAVLGPATESITAGVTVLTWKDGDAVATVIFEGDKTTSITADGLEQESSKVTRENFDKIKEGMSSKEVLDILGPYRQLTLVPMAKSYTWRFGEKLINVLFEGDRVKVKALQ